MTGIADHLLEEFVAEFVDGSRRVGVFHQDDDRLAAFEQVDLAARSLEEREAFAGRCVAQRLGDGEGVDLGVRDVAVCL